MHVRPQSLFVVWLSLFLLVLALMPNNVVVFAARVRGMRRNGPRGRLLGASACVHHGGFDTTNECSQGPWPSCICATGAACKAHILSLDPSLQGKVWVIPSGTAVTKDKRTNRVRIFVDNTGKVLSAPRRG